MQEGHTTLLQGDNTIQNTNPTQATQTTQGTQSSNTPKVKPLWQYGVLLF
ncbi:hypothetical protein [Helicobacter heilmannii]|uniref:Uncharacterized protein n=1 Tax=Helicobacter heilmannii TaxID=35817 RepID=A0A0K2XG54_HELHE|nr:hypothetical protein [Helicobacter heilmannii]CCM10898.1 hypothetical protein BN341_18670 [Helicobacter heilmannii ASB1.4]CRF45071.1 hypothetical protein HHE014_00180 [Helicobacter heilmannii]CRF48083.1 hypothetical protein HHE02_13910 [Helicobacter heilmannii]CRF49400.1 hypothetical protein HHE03_10120 [Helicobacter heilmannii]CRF50913.1 hypothetical protein HHE06_07710 [Helicobacter heilmannii]